MKLTIDFSDITGMVSRDEITDEWTEEAEDMMVGIYTDLTASPPLGTPVDSGAARNSWQIDTADPLHPEVYTTSPYMGRLNDGHSQQSPSGFIDAVADKWTR